MFTRLTGLKVRAVDRTMRAVLPWSAQVIVGLPFGGIKDILNFLEYPDSAGTRPLARLFRRPV